MRIKMQESESKESLSFKGCDVAIVGKPIDDRGFAAVDFLRSNANDIVFMEYNADEFEIDFNGKRFGVDELDKYFSRLQGKTVYLEATTLGFVEIFLSCRVLQHLGFRKTTLFYVEPQRYSKFKRYELLHKRDFDLSDEFPGYQAIPGATCMLSDRSVQIGVFFLGYEERRLDRALEDYQMIQPSKCCVVFGVPAFKPGWEMDAFTNNIRVIRDKNIRGGILYCGAENPAAVVDLLEEIYCSLRPNERMFVSPIGTKPNGIGSAIFVSMHPDVGILYDHPIRKKGRSEQVSKWHLYEVEFGAICA